MGHSWEMDEETKSLLERAERVIADAVQPDAIERWEFQGDQIVSISGPPEHPECLFMSVAFVCDADEEYGKARGRLLAESRRLVPALRDALLKLDVEREAERTAWQDYATALAGLRRWVSHEHEFKMCALHDLALARLQALGAIGTN